MRWNRIVAVIAVNCLMSSVLAADVNHVVRHTLCTNPTVKAAEAGQETAYHSWWAAKGGYFPQVTLTGAYGRERSANPAVKAFMQNSITLTRTEAAVTLSQLVFDGGEVSGTVAERFYQFIASRFRLHDVRESVILETIETYINVLRNRRLVELAEQNVRDHKATLTKVQLRVKAGAGRRVENSLAMSRLTKAQAQLAATQGELMLANVRFLRVTGHPVFPQMIRPNKPMKFIPDNLHVALHNTLVHNPALQSAKADLLAAQAGVKVASSRFWPRLNLQLSATENDNLDGIEGNNRDAVALLVMNYDLFRGGTDLNNWRVSKSERCRTMRIVQDVDRSVTENLRLAWAEMITSGREIDRLREHVKYTEKVVEDYQIQFELGQRPLFNVLDAQNDLFTAKVSFTNSEMNNLISYYRILKATGCVTFAVYAPIIPTPTLPVPGPI